MVTRFFTKNVTREMWKQTTGNLSFKKRNLFFQKHMIESLTYLEECQRRYQKLISPRDSDSVPKFFMDYMQISNLSNAVHYLTKYTEHIDKTEKLLHKNKFSEIDEDDDFLYSGASVTNGHTLPCLLFQRKLKPFKHPLSDDQLDDYALKNVATLMQLPVPKSAKEYIEELKKDNSGKFVYNKFKRSGAKFATEAFLHENGYPEILDRRTIENIIVGATEDITTENVPRNFQDAVKLLADPTYLPLRKELYPVFPWLDPSWSAPSAPMPPPPFYPASWFYFVENIGRLVYELWTSEYVTALAEYLGRRCEVRGENLYRIVEIGAGDGRLTYFLRKKLDELGHHNIDIVATDTGAWESDTCLPVARVKDTKSTLRQYNPKMVICSWMVPQVDLTQEFRNHHSVDEYILIGPPNGDISGKSWETWGHSTDKDATQPPPYIEDGFQRYELKYVSLFQIAQNCGPYFQFASRTVAFRRMTEEQLAMREHAEEEKYKNN